jgi:hypothetical protein
MVTDISDLLTEDEDNDTPTITKLRRALKALAKERDTAVSESEGFKVQAREGNVTSWLKDAKIKPEVKAYVPDEVDSAAALAAWLTGPGALFAALKDDPVAPDAATPQAPAQQDFGDTDAGRLLAQVAASEAGARSAITGDLDAIIAKMGEAASATSEEEMYRILRNVPLPDGLAAQG